MSQQQLRCPVCGTVMGVLSKSEKDTQRNFSHHCINHPNGLRVLAGLGLAGYLINKEYWTFYIPKELLDGNKA